MTWLAAFLSLPLWLPPVPGAVDPVVSQAGIHWQICAPGWAAMQRPPQAVTEPIKRRLLAASGYRDKRLRDFELDHVVPLELGGDPLDAANLWLEPRAGRCGAAIKDRLENALHGLVCAGELSLAAAQHEIATDWVASYSRHIAPLACE